MLVEESFNVFLVFFGKMWVEFFKYYILIEIVIFMFFCVVIFVFVVIVIIFYYFILVFYFYKVLFLVIYIEMINNV